MLLRRPVRRRLVQSGHAGPARPYHSGVATRPEVPDSTSPGLGTEDAAASRTSRPQEPPGRDGFVPQGLPGPSRAPLSPPARTPTAPRSRALGVLLWLALALGLAGMATGVLGGVAQFLPRTFTRTQSREIMAWEVGQRWRTWPAGKIFPARISYRLTGSVLGGSTSLVLTARRIGIAPQAGCEQATDPALGRLLDRHGCLAVLRATYADATGALAVTVGVVVLPSASAAARASSAALPSQNGPGLRAVPFSHTVVAGFGDPERQLRLTWKLAPGPYLILATAGYADGRRRAQETAGLYAQGEMRGAAEGIMRWVASHLGAPPPRPKCPNGPAC